MEDTWDTQFRDSTRFWVQFVLVPLVVTVGLLGNCATIFILTKRQSKLPSNVYLTALAFSDFLFLIFSFSMSWKHYEFMKSQYLYWNYIPFGLWITDASSSTSVWLTVCFTIERYMAICHPTLLTSAPTVKRANRVAMCVYVICFLCTFSTSWEWRATTTTQATRNLSDVLTNGTTYILENTALGRNSWYRLIYHWFSTIFFVFVPLAILAVGNLFLINAVRASRKIRNGLISCYVHRRQAQLMRQEDRITTTLIVIIIVFLMCQMPTAIVLIYTSMHTPPVQGSVEENVLFGLGNIFNLLVAVNASCNFLLYTAISDKYRKEFSKFFCFSVIKRRGGNKRRRRQTLIILPNALSLEERLRYAQQQGELEKDAIVCSSGDVFQNVRIKNVVILKRCATCEENEKRAGSSQGDPCGAVTV